MQQVLAISIGAILGALLRYCCYRLALSCSVETYWATIAVNLTGSLAMGLVMTTMAAWSALPLWIQPMLVTGFLGAFTTMSSFAWDVVNKAGQGQLSISFALAVLESGMSMFMCYLGVVVGRKLFVNS